MTNDSCFSCYHNGADLFAQEYLLYKSGICKRQRMGHCASVMMERERQLLPSRVCRFISDINLKLCHRTECVTQTEKRLQFQFQRFHQHTPDPSSEWALIALHRAVMLTCFRLQEPGWDLLNKLQQGGGHKEDLTHRGGEGHLQSNEQDRGHDQYWDRVVQRPGQESRAVSSLSPTINTC